MSTNQFDSIFYRGDISISVMQRSKLILQRKFHNRGRKPLFTHIIHCLAGNYIDAEEFRPLVLRCFTVPYSATEEGKKPNDLDPYFNIADYANIDNVSTSTIATFLKSPSWNLDSDPNRASVTYEFSIPFTSILTDHVNLEGWKSLGYNITPINLVCLYGKSNVGRDNIGDPSAYFFVTDTADNLISLLPKDITSNVGDYSLVIKWTLTVSNSNN